MKHTLSIVGFGNIGRAICTQLLPWNEFSFHINIMDPNPKVTGAVLDFQHGAQLFPQHEITLNDKEAFNNSGYIFHCAGASVPKGKSRLDTCQESVLMTEAIFKDFRPTGLPFIIVVSNPVEIIAFITQKITGLPAKNVMGTGTFLDSIRMNYLLKKQFNQVDMILLGEHGSSVFVSEQLSKVDGKPISSAYSSNELEKYLNEVKKAAAEIKQTQDATIYGVSYCAVRLFEALLSEKDHFYPISTQVPEYLREKLSSKDIYLSCLSKINHEGAFLIENYFPNESETEKFKKAADTLISCIPFNYLH